MPLAVVLGAGGFIGHHLVRRLVTEGYTVLEYDKHGAEWPCMHRDYDLTVYYDAQRAVAHADEVYQLATDMGGAGYIFTGEHDYQVMSTGAQINLNVIRACLQQTRKPKVFFSSSACVYNQFLQQDESRPDDYTLRETDAYPAHPDSEYGWEKLFSERCYLAAARNHGLQVRIARFHSIVGPECTWRGGREKVFAAACRKVAECPDGGTIEIWGDGQQTRTFLHIDDCLDGVRALMQSDHTGPFNIGSPELVSITALYWAIAVYARKTVEFRYVAGPEGVRGRCSDNTAMETLVGWRPTRSIEDAIRETYDWVAGQVEAARG